MSFFVYISQIIKEKLQSWLHTLKVIILKQVKANTTFTESKWVYQIVITVFFEQIWTIIWYLRSWKWLELFFVENFLGSS